MLFIKELSIKLLFVTSLNHIIFKILLLTDLTANLALIELKENESFTYIEVDLYYNQWPALTLFWEVSFKPW